MNGLDFWPIVERDHRIQNPISADKLMLLADYCRIDDGMKILDVGSGKGWLLRNWAQTWDIAGTGLEINPAFIAEARTLAAEEELDGRVRFVEGLARSFEPDPDGYDVVLCIGASFALGTVDQAIDWMRRALRPGAVLALGEVFFRERPPIEAIQQGAIGADDYLDLYGVVRELARQELELTGLIAASEDDWDHYYSMWWRAAREWCDDNPDDPFAPEVRERIAKERENYLRWERRSLGWGIFVARPTEDR